MEYILIYDEAAGTYTIARRIWNSGDSLIFEKDPTANWHVYKTRWRAEKLLNKLNSTFGKYR